jgi:hypothetical protein
MGLTVSPLRKDAKHPLPIRITRIRHILWASTFLDTICRHLVMLQQLNVMLGVKDSSRVDRGVGL